MQELENKVKKITVEYEDGSMGIGDLRGEYENWTA